MAENCRSFLSLKPTLPGLMRYLSSASAQAGMIGQQLVADVMEVADDRHVDADLEQPLLDLRHGGGGLVAVDRDAHDLGAGARQRRHLARRSRRHRRCRCWSSTAPRPARRRRPSHCRPEPAPNGASPPALPASCIACSMARHIALPGPVDEYQPGRHQHHGKRKSRRQRLAQHQMAGRDPEKRRQKCEGREAAGRELHDQREPQAEGRADHDGLIGERAERHAPTAWP